MENNNLNEENQKLNNEDLSTTNTVSTNKDTIKADKKKKIDLNPHEKKKKQNQKKLIIFLIFFLVCAVCGVVAYLSISAMQTNNHLFRLKNVDATVKVHSYMVKDNNEIPIYINGQESAEFVFNAYDTDEDDILNRNVAYDNVNLDMNDTLRIFYEIKNTSTEANMYVNFMKLNSYDHNFNLDTYYKVGKSDITTNKYYCQKGLYYSIGNTTVQGLSEFIIGNYIKVTPGETLTIRIEFKSSEIDSDSKCECNFRFDLINEYYVNL